MEHSEAMHSLASGGGEDKGSHKVKETTKHQLLDIDGVAIIPWHRPVRRGVRNELAAGPQRHSRSARFDRIVAVNGRTSGPDMQHALATETALNLRLFRYAPPDLCAATPDERRESVIRRRSSAYWEDRESTRRAVEALQKRLGESEHSQEPQRRTTQTHHSACA